MSANQLSKVVCSRITESTYNKLKKLLDQFPGKVMGEIIREAIIHGIARMENKSHDSSK